MITVIGIGPGGTQDYLFGKAQAAIQAADLIIGSQRQLEIIPKNKKHKWIIALLLIYLITSEQKTTLILIYR
jgi:precorrin-6B methylase 1